MKNWKAELCKAAIFFVMFGIVIAPLLYVAFREVPAVTNLYENMVNATVSIYDDSGRGSGIFIADNVILTTAHMLENVKVCNIELSDGTVLKSSNFYIDTKEDVAFVFVDANEPHIAQVSPRTINLGDTVYLVGAPFADLFKLTLTKGIASHLDRDLPLFNWKDLLQVDANGGPGSSGGPLYDSVGNVIGMYVGHAGGGGRGISFCESAQSILEAYKRYKDATNVEGN